MTPVAHAQKFSVGGTFGWVNDATVDFGFDGFKPSEVTAWVDYRFERYSLLRVTYGNMWTRQTYSEKTVDTSEGPLAVPEMKEQVGYFTIGASYIFLESFFDSGVFGGIGGYGIRPDTPPPGFAEFADRDETVFGWHFGSEAFFSVHKNVGLVVRLTYHNVSAHPHRQFLNADIGITARF
jgi:hypothetical protein